jgi:hypothetical protein
MRRFRLTKQLQPRSRALQGSSPEGTHDVCKAFINLWG